MATNLYHCGRCAEDKTLTPTERYCRADGDHPAVKCPRCAGRSELVMHGIDTIHLIRPDPASGMKSTQNGRTYSILCASEIREWGVCQVSDLPSAVTCPKCREIAEAEADTDDGLPAARPLTA